MDLKDESWYAQLQINGIHTPINESGSIVSIISQMAAHIKSANTPRTRDKGFAILFSTSPFGADKALREAESLIHEIASSLDTSADESIPLPDEGIGPYIIRMQDAGYDELTTHMLASDWFGGPDNPALALGLQWINDSRAQRFRQLNASQEAFESAMPNEYATLKHYCRETYPEQYSRLTLRTA